MADIVSQKSTDEGMPKLKTEELFSKTAELKQSSASLLVANEALRLKTEELNRSQAFIRIKPRTCFDE
jgi:hypothetical protein